ncbi:Cgr1 family-domain-containing protein [Protomyces lactucae-debilis]|uniref:rRNA-processing protein n=1 Tax=Protomyces lactucae-debilis TaxID=2754530 RepID=A0A1Y2EYL8_PROLT|nr:Cgr1 family-domain-containing protein [Protomyces lactucae-debilis]ORY76688.1 Cgr1 family-domain-containing protein [Protomyces lactucae-debilis]
MTARSRALAALHSPTESDITAAPAQQITVPSVRVSGKQWKLPKTATTRSQLPSSRRTPYALRQQESQRQKEVKIKESELRAEAKQELENRKRAIQEKREKREEKERFERLKEKMHKKTVDRIKKREKRNKLLKDR